MSQPAALAARSRIAGLSSIRFVCACWVVVSHVGIFPPAAAGAPRWSAARVVRSLAGIGFNGAAAVMVFFLISGFCIHYLHGARATPSWPRYFARRYLRIGIPLVAAIAIYRALGLSLGLYNDAVMWSLTAEIIYYSIYPLLLFAKRKLGWPALLACAYAAAAAVYLSHPLADTYHAYGDGLTWILGLPSWLLGCKLAEESAALPPRPTAPWRARVAIWAASVACLVLHFHSPLRHGLTLTLFGAACYLWLRQEVAFFQTARAPALLEWAGDWSYSLYLVHTAAAGLLVGTTFAVAHPIVAHELRYVLALACAYAFYLCFERPAHLVARRLGS